MGYKIISKVLCQRLKGLLPNLISETQSAFVSGRLISDNMLIAQEMFHGLRTNNSCKEKFSAKKTDMSKTYDRVEWAFLQRLLLKMGFSRDRVVLIMQCKSLVSYKVLINGQPKGYVVPIETGGSAVSVSFYLVYGSSYCEYSEGGKGKAFNRSKNSTGKPINLSFVICG